jgi:hypothetical protein
MERLVLLEAPSPYFKVSIFVNSVVGYQWLSSVVGSNRLCCHHWEPFLSPGSPYKIFSRNRLDSFSGVRSMGFFCRISVEFCNFYYFFIL